MSFIYGSDLFLYTDEISFNKVKDNDFVNFDEKISFPNFYKCLVNRSLFKGSFFSFIPRRLIFKSFIYSNFCIAIFVFKNFFNVKVLQIYFCLEFSLFFEFKNYIDSSDLNKVYFTDHYCKYAIYFCLFKFPKKIQIQHGILSDKFLPKHLIFVNICFVFDSAQKDIFLTNLHFSGVSYVIYKPLINFVSLYENVFSIFFISRMDSFQLEKELIKQIRTLWDDKCVKIMLKPHPKMSKFKYSDRFYSDNFVLIITDVFFYPHANFIISSNSTMKKEYDIYDFETCLFNENQIIEVLSDRINSFYEDL
jgi:hypothetical protein